MQQICEMKKTETGEFLSFFPRNLLNRCLNRLLKLLPSIFLTVDLLIKSTLQYQLYYAGFHERQNTFVFRLARSKSGTLKLLTLL